MLKINHFLLVFTSVLLLHPGLTLAESDTPSGTTKVDRTDRIERRLDDRVASISARLNNIIGRHTVLTGAKLTSMNRSTLSVTSENKSYMINTDSHTVFRRRFWGKAALSEMTVGDTLNIYGKWTDTAKTTILANLVRDTSIQKHNAVFVGTISAINGNTWTVNTVARGTQTATISSTAKFINRREQTISQTDILVGHRIRVRGMWDNQANTITEITAVKDFSLPPISTPTPQL